MLIKTCSGCGSTFEAQKQSRRYCSDTCSRRSRRAAKRVADCVPNPVISVINPVVAPDKPDAETAVAVVECAIDAIAFARAVNPALVLSLDLLDGLLTHGRSAAATEADYDAVQGVLVLRAVAALEGLQAGSASVDDVVADLKLLTDFWADFISEEIVAALAASL